MKKIVDIHNYDDILNRPRHVSKVYPSMSIQDRAAQFAPFAALTGHKSAINETARFVETKRILDEQQKEWLDQKIQLIYQNIHHCPLISVTYFVKDPLKKGGKYLSVQDNVKCIHEYEHVIVFKNGLKIDIKDIYDLEIL